jgi:hypothetical protein
MLSDEAAIRWLVLTASVCSLPNAPPSSNTIFPPKPPRNNHQNKMKTFGLALVSASSPLAVPNAADPVAAAKTNKAAAVPAIKPAEASFRGAGGKKEFFPFGFGSGFGYPGWSWGTGWGFPSWGGLFWGWKSTWRLNLTSQLASPK